MEATLLLGLIIRWKNKGKKYGITNIQNRWWIGRIEGRLRITEGR